MALVIVLVELVLVILVIAWFVGWRRETRERLGDVQARLERIENRLLQQRDQTRG